jgi:hypothetical protein
MFTYLPPSPDFCLGILRLFYYLPVHKNFLLLLQNCIIHYRHPVSSSRPGRNQVKLSSFKLSLYRQFELQKPTTFARNFLLLSCLCQDEEIEFAVVHPAVYSRFYKQAVIKKINPNTMKKLIAIILFLTASFGLPMYAQELKSEFLFDLELNVSTPQAIGPVLTGTRVIFPFTGGFVKGDKIIGKVLPGGGDWGLNLDSATFKLDVRGTIETDDNALIYFTYSGYLHADPKKFAMINAGRANELSPSDYYFRSNPMFETSSPKYAWLNHTVAIGTGRLPEAGKVVYRIYAIK